MLEHGIRENHGVSVSCDCFLFKMDHCAIQTILTYYDQHTPFYSQLHMFSCSVYCKISVTFCCSIIIGELEDYMVKQFSLKVCATFPTMTM